MITLRKSEDRGHADHGWLQSRHSFSFADYRDATHMNCGKLRVINEDRIAPGAGFGTHAHRDMEIVTCVLSGALMHRDSMGNGEVILPGEVQRMSAGRGVQHSEFNHLTDAWTHLLQIWIEPNALGIEAGYEQKHFADADKRGRLCLIASSDGREGSVTIHADAAVRAGLFDGAERFELPLDASRLTYVHVVRGGLGVNGIQLSAGDAATLSGEPRLVLDDAQGAEVLVFDLAA